MTTPISDAYQAEHVRNHATDAKDLQYNMGLECGMECARHIEEILWQTQKEVFDAKARVKELENGRRV